MLNPYKTRIREIFTSIQGEGLQVGKKHIFVRFCKCNLNCEFCDTDFNSENSKIYSIDELYETLKEIDCNTISFTGGEPLMDVEFLYLFLEKYKEKLQKKIYLETNGVLFEQLEKIIDFVDFIAMDIKIQSATGQQNRFLINEKFLNIATKKEVFIKVVFDKNIIQDEIDNITYLAQKNNTEIVLQPKMPMDSEIDLEKIFENFYKKTNKIRLVPQIHKFLNLA